MKSFVLSVFFVTFLFAQYPKVYTQLGDEIYANVSKIEHLADLRELTPYKNQIEIYVYEVEKAKEYGFLVENGDQNVVKEIYLEDLRELIKTNNFFKQLVQEFFEDSLQKQNSVLFFHLVQSGLLDIAKYEEHILAYYRSHVEDVPREGVIDMLLVKQEESEKKRQAAQKARESVTYKTQKESQEEKIERLRKIDQEKKEALRRTLDEEEARKKAEIIQKQKEELGQ